MSDKLCLNCTKQFIGWSQLTRAEKLSETGRPINLQATKLFIVTSATKGSGYHPPLRFCVRFKILYRVIQPLIQHCLLHKMVYLNIIYIIATRKYEFFTIGIFP